MSAEPTTTPPPAPASSVWQDLEPDQRQMIAESPRASRVGLLAQFRREREIDTVQKLAKEEGLPAKVEFSLHPDATQQLPLRLIHEFQCLPFTNGDDSPLLHLVTVWPPDPEMHDWVTAVTGQEPLWYLGPPKDIVDTITQNFGVGAASLSESEVAEGEVDDLRAADDSEDENAAIIRFVNEVVAKAIEDRATDIHFEPLKESLQIRYRIDGELVPIRVPENLVRFQSAIISRLKIMAKLNISEKRRPQDGRINYRAAGEDLDIRISTMPTMYGESISLRLLNQKSQPLTFEELGMMSGDRKAIESVLDLPHGIILVTGPTGSGKSTSLNAFIRTINTPGRRIITVEDPVEYEVAGVNQTQVHADIGFTFAAALRHILRQDPDVIMVGEIRDRETAEIGIRASLTGHLVLSTIHTNDAPGALTRLIDMEIEPFLIASAIQLIIAQRLVRRLCEKCKRPRPHDEAFLRESLRALKIEPTEEDLQTTIYEPVGCDHCRGLGYRGRIGLFEILRVNDELHDLIVQKQSARVIREKALAEGMITLQSSGWQQVKRGLTAMSEVLRFSSHGDEGEEA